MGKRISGGGGGLLRTLRGSIDGVCEGLTVKETGWEKMSPGLPKYLNSTVLSCLARVNKSKQIAFAYSN